MRIRTKTLIYIVFLSVFVFYIICGTIVEKKQDADRSVVVTVSCGGIQGSGVIYKITEHTISILSVKHILSAGTKVFVTFQDGNMICGEVTYLSEQHDFGFAEIETKSLSKSQLKKITEVQKDMNTTLDKNEKIYCLVTDADKNLQRLDGIFLTEEFVPDVNDTVLITDCIVSHGMSGGGLFNEQGIFMGILLAGNGTSSIFMPVTNIIMEERND